MTTSLLMLGAACAGKCCPPHALAAVGGAVVVGFVAGWLVGRRGKKCGGKPKGACKCASRAARSAADSVRTPIPAGSVEIYVGNLSYDLTEDGLRKEFEAFGKVASARIVFNRANGKSKGFGFVVMPNRPEAEKAVDALNDKDILGRKLHCNEAKNTVKEG